MRQVARPNRGRTIAKPKVGMYIDILTFDVGIDRGFVIIFNPFAVLGQGNAANGNGQFVWICGNTESGARKPRP